MKCIFKYKYRAKSIAEKNSKNYDLKQIINKLLKNPHLRVNLN